jgi:hypothetical protein
MSKNLAKWHSSNIPEQWFLVGHATLHQFWTVRKKRQLSGECLSQNNIESFDTLD